MKNCEYRIGERFGVYDPYLPGFHMESLVAVVAYKGKYCLVSFHEEFKRYSLLRIETVITTMGVRIEPQPVGVMAVSIDDILSTEGVRLVLPQGWGQLPQNL